VLVKLQIQVDETNMVDCAPFYVFEPKKPIWLYNCGLILGT